MLFREILNILSVTRDNVIIFKKFCFVRKFLSHYFEKVSHYFEFLILRKSHYFEILTNFEKVSHYFESFSL